MFNLTKLAQSLKDMTPEQLMARANAIKDFNTPEGKALIDEISLRSSKDKKLSNFLFNTLADRLAASATEAEEQEYRDRMSSDASGARNQIMQLMNEINLVSYNLLNKVVGEFQTLPPQIRACRSRFISSFTKKYNFDQNTPGGKKTYGQWFSDRLADTHLRENLFNKYDFISPSSQILRYYAELDFYSKGEYLKGNLGEDVSKVFSEYYLPHISGLDPDNSDPQLFRNRINARKYEHSALQYRHMPLHAHEIDGEFLIIKVMKHFLESLKAERQEAVCFALDKFAYNINYDIKVLEYQQKHFQNSESDTGFGATKANLNYLKSNSFRYVLAPNSIGIAMAELDRLEAEEYKSIDKLNSKLPDGDSPAKKYIEKIKTELSECIMEARHWFQNIRKWHELQSSSYIESNNSINFLEIALNHRATSTGVHGQGGVDGSVQKGTWSPIKFSKDSIEVRVYFQATGQIVNDKYYEYMSDDDYNKPINYKLEGKVEIYPVSIKAKVPQSLSITCIECDPSFNPETRKESLMVSQADSVLSQIESTDKYSKLRDLGQILKAGKIPYFGLKSIPSLSDEEAANLKDQVIELFSKNPDYIFDIIKSFKEQKVKMPQIPSSYSFEDRSWSGQEAEGAFRELAIVRSILHDIEIRYKYAVRHISKDIGLTEEAFECYDTIGSIAISSKISELDKSINYLNKSDPNNDKISEVKKMKEKFVELKKFMDSIFSNYQKTGWMSAGMSSPDDIYVDPTWLILAIQKDKASKVFVDPAEIENIIEGHLRNLNNNEIFDLGALLKIINLASLQKGKVQLNEAGKMIGDAVKNAKTLGVLSDEDAENIRNIFPSFKAGSDGDSYMIASGMSKTSYINSAQGINKYSYNLSDFSQEQSMNYSINDWIKFVARRAYIGK